MIKILGFVALGVALVAIILYCLRFILEMLSDIFDYFN